MVSTFNKRNIILILSLVCFAIFIVAAIANALEEAKILNLRNANDSLMAIIELKKESGGNYNKAKADHIEMLRQYVGHMDSRDLSFLFQLPPFSNKNVTKELERAVEDLEKADQLNARKAIENASNSIAKFLAQSKSFTSEPITTFEPEVIPQELQTVTKKALADSHEKVEKYADDSNMTNAEKACWTNRKAIAYVYLCRFGLQNFVDQEELRTFRTDMNRCIYYNRVLQQTSISEEERTRLTEYSNSDIRRLQLLQAIIDNDIQQAQTLLLIAVEEVFPGTEF